MNFFDIENLEKLASTIASVEEFKTQPPPSSSNTSSDHASNVATLNRTRQALNAWQSIEIEGKRREWEAACIRIKSQANSSDPNLWEERAMESEYNLVRIYSMLIDAPDPVPLLSSVQNLSSRIMELESVNRQLATEASSASADAQEVQTLIQDHRQLQVEHKALKEHLDKVVDDLSGAHELAEAGRKAMSELGAQGHEMLRLQMSLKASREECEVAQTRLFEIQQERDQEAGSRAMEADVILVDLERALQRIQELEAQLISQTGNKEASDASTSSFWEQQLHSRMDQIAVLESQLEASRATSKDQTTKHDLLIQQAANKTTSLEIQLDQLRQELGKRPTAKVHDDLIQRVEALQLLADVQMESEGWTVPSSSSSRPSDAITSLIGAQSAMQERNRKLSSDVTSLKQKLSDEAGRREEAERKLTLAQSECERLSGLARKLESDLTLSSATSLPQNQEERERESSALTLGLPSPSKGDSKGGMGGSEGSSSLLDIVVSQRDRFRSRVNQLEEDKAKALDDHSQARKQLDEVRSDNVSLYEKIRFLERYQGQHHEGGGAGLGVNNLGGGGLGGAGAGAGVGGGVRVAVVKVDDAGVRQPEEEDRRAGRYQCGPFAVEIGGVGGKTTSHPDTSSSSFLISSNSSGASKVRSRAKAQRMIAGCFPADAIEGEGDEEAPTPLEQRYKRDYEARVNPFAEFQKNETDQRMQRMPVHDRALLAGSKALVGSKFARALAAVYMVLMHLFFIVLLYSALSPVGCHTVEVVDASKLGQIKDAAISQVPK